MALWLEEPGSTSAGAPFGPAVAALLLKLGEGRSDMNLDHLGCALAYLYIVYTAHVLHDVVGEVVAGHLDTLVGHDAAKRDHSNLSGTTAYVNDHVALRREHVDTDTESGGHGFVDHVDVTASGMLGRVTHGADLNLGGS